MTKDSCATITGIGAYLPEQILTNEDLEKMVETSDEWITTRTGIKERRIAHDREFPSTMGIKAAKRALKAANLEPEELDAIIVATMTPDYISPSTAALIQDGLKATRACAVDIQAACTGFLYGLSIAKAWVESGAFNNVLLICAEKNSAFIDYQDRNTCVLFGDGSGAVVVQNGGSGFAIRHVCLGADGSQSQLIIIPGGGSAFPASHETVNNKKHFFKMEGKEVFKLAVRYMEASCKECLKQTGLKEENISWIVPHQANFRIMEAIAKRFNISWDKVYKTIHKYGNTSSSTIPIALQELEEQQNPKQNDNILLVAFGGGLTWGASLLTKV